MAQLLHSLTVNHARRYMGANDPVAYLLSLLKRNNVEETQAHVLELEEALQAIYLDIFL